MRWEGAMEVMRVGRFAVLDRGVPLSRREQAEDRPRYAVVEYDGAGPILRAGPFRVLRIAVETCQQFNFRAELDLQQEEQHAARR